MTPATSGNSDPTIRPRPFAEAYCEDLTRNYSDAKARDHAIEHISYFAPLVERTQRDVWRDGLSTAREWLRLIDAVDRTPQEMASLVAIAYANVYRSTGWLHMAACIRRWAEIHGSEVPTSHDFFDEAAWRGRTRPPKKKKWWEFWK